MSRRFAPAKPLIYISLLLIVMVVFLLIKGSLFSPGSQALAVVDEFYRYEQEGEFSKSWSLFHSAMQEKFSKDNYIQDRAHVFMSHFGVETFTYKLGKPEKLEKWKMSESGKEHKNIFKVSVTQTYKSKYGTLKLNQEVYLIKEKEKWKIAWDYNH